MMCCHGNIYLTGVAGACGCGSTYTDCDDCGDFDLPAGGRLLREKHSRVDQLAALFELPLLGFQPAPQNTVQVSLVSIYLRNEFTKYEYVIN